MADIVVGYAGPQNVQVDTGKGQLAGLVVTADQAAPVSIVLWDYAGAGPPAGTKFFEAVVCQSYPLVLFFQDRYSPRFTNGAWLVLTDGLYATLWFSFPKT